MMLSLSMPTTATTRSSLELMLDSFLRMDEPSSDLPPALPARPTSRARLPPARKPLPMKFRRGILTEVSEGDRKELEEFVEEEKTDESNRLCALMKIGICKNTNERTLELEGILEIQKCIRGFQARHFFDELRRGSLTLQTFVRGENARKDYEVLMRKLTAVIVIQRHVKGWIAWTMLQRKKKACLRIQRAIRGWLSRRNLQLTNPIEENVRVSKSIISDLQRRLFKAEREFARKEVENADLYREIRRFEERWLEYDERMKYLETSWQDQLSSLQRKLTEEEEKDNRQLGSCDSFNMYFRMNGGDHQKKKEKGDDGRLRADDELKKLKVRYEEWKKDYKIKLKETKTVLQKLGQPEKKTIMKKWWGL
ncbi:myosin-2-like [Impatiens glandulifera]|uniref:myosin-2-like n=1 Tax=Impatiens glandulifera TaxID=253017 RepID=UPI001FB1700F|nr:myosin-2-like [Impatiens glandulifera]